MIQQEPGPGLDRAASPGKSRHPWRSRRRARLLAAVLLAVLAVIASCLAGTTRKAPVHSRPGRGDPLSGIQLFVDPRSPVAQAEASLHRSNPAAAALLRKIASHPTGIWFGDWNPVGQVAAAVRTVMSEAAARHSVPLLVLYAFPHRDCGQQAGGPLAEPADYERWIGQMVAGIGTGKAVVVLEPDALAQYILLGCLSSAAQRQRLATIRQAVGQLAALTNTVVYIDAGNSRWRSAKVMASLLLAAGVSKVRGFSLNVSNFNSAAAEESYGASLSAMLNGAHFVIDVSRNGVATAKTWCNPPGQALGVPPTADTGNPLVDAMLWIKPPWASDGTCNGGSPAGTIWLPYALGLAARARW
jgi:endoglucanase